MPTKKTAPKAENPKLTKILDEVHTEKQYHGFVDKYAEYMAVHNMGHDPADTHFQDLLCEEEAAQAMYEEKRGWVKVARPILDELKRMKKPLTIREAEKVYDSNPKKWGKPYGS